MTAVAEVQVRCIEVYQTDKHGHEHVLVVVLRQELVDGHRDAYRVVALLGDDTEQVTGYGHEQRCGNSLSAHVTHAEVHLVALNEEVVQVTSHLLRRSHGSEQVYIISVREGREDTGHHAHLDVAGHLELLLYGSRSGRSLLHLIDVFDERMLHPAERLVQTSEFVDTAVVRQFLVQLSRRNGFNLARELAQGVQFAGNDASAGEKHQEQTQKENNQDDALHALQTAEDIAQRAYDGGAPTGVSQGFVEDIAFFTVDGQWKISLFAILHSLSQSCTLRIRIFQSLGIDRLIEQLC